MDIEALDTAIAKIQDQIVLLKRESDKERRRFLPIARIFQCQAEGMQAALDILIEARKEVTA